MCNYGCCGMQNNFMPNGFGGSLNNFEPFGSYGNGRRKK